MTKIPYEITTESLVTLCKDLAIISNDWKIMKHFSWNIITNFQIHNPQFNKDIATYASHVSGRHTYCQNCTPDIPILSQTVLAFPDSEVKHTHK